MSIHSRTSQRLGIVYAPAGLIVALGLISACASERDRRRDAQPSQSEYRVVELEPSTAERSAAERSAEHDDAQWRITAVVIDVGLADLCGIDAARANFDYDSAELDADSRETIAVLADCFIEGPLTGREVVVIGHADPRGPDEYNRELGMSRADAVAQALTREGLASARIDVESHGEAEAHADPSEWPDDRRVDVLIAN
jgi:outer membrane protein OmpA-like peptidoglycan-associated protein